MARKARAQSVAWGCSSPARDRQHHDCGSLLLPNPAHPPFPSGLDFHYASKRHRLQRPSRGASQRWVVVFHKPFFPRLFVPLAPHILHRPSPLLSTETILTGERSSANGTEQLLVSFSTGPCESEVATFSLSGTTRPSCPLLFQPIPRRYHRNLYPPLFCRLPLLQPRQIPLHATRESMQTQLFVAPSPNARPGRFWQPLPRRHATCML